MFLRYSNQLVHINTMPGRRLYSMCAMAVEYGFTHLWIMPGVCVPDKEWFFEAAACLDWDLLPTWQWGEDDALANEFATDLNLLVSCTGCRRPKGGQHWFTIIFVAQTQWSWATDDLTSARLLEIVGNLETSLGVPVAAGPTTVGTKLLQKIHAKRPTLLAAPHTDLSEIPFAQAARDLRWERPLTIAELASTYLHKFDKNSAYLRSCQEEYVGVGEPEHLTTSHVYTANNDICLPGIYKIQLRHMREESLLPPPLWKDAEWVAAPILKMLLKYGAIVSAEEAWLFPSTARTLRPWAEKLWDSRLAFKQAGKQEEADGIKDIAASTAGLFNSEKLKGTWKYRPDWWSQIVGGTWAMMFYNMLKFAAESGAYPVMAYTDSLFYISDEKLPGEAVRGILSHQNSLGGYRHEWTLPLQEPDVRDAIDSNAPLNLKIGVLNDLAEEYYEHD